MIRLTTDAMSALQHSFEAHNELWICPTTAPVLDSSSSYHIQEFKARAGHLEARGHLGLHASQGVCEEHIGVHVIQRRCILLVVRPLVVRLTLLMPLALREKESFTSAAGAHACLHMPGST